MGRPPPNGVIFACFGFIFFFVTKFLDDSVRFLLEKLKKTRYFDQKPEYLKASPLPPAPYVMAWGLPYVVQGLSFAAQGLHMAAQGLHMASQGLHLAAQGLHFGCTGAA